MLSWGVVAGTICHTSDDQHATREADSALRQVFDETVLKVVELIIVRRQHPNMI